MSGRSLRIAVPLEGDRISNHFGHSESFCLFSVDPDSRKIVAEERLAPPPHERGGPPKWLAELGIDVVLARGIGQRAVARLESIGVDVQTGVPSLEASEAVRKWLADDLKTTGKVCDGSGKRHRCRGQS
jgi:predicted Fe-Mo cluster-binding NifX family protein